MTPFGARVHAPLPTRVTMAQMADALSISSAYLSALEHGKRGLSVALVHQICQYFDLIWDDAEALQALAVIPTRASWSIPPG